MRFVKNFYLRQSAFALLNAGCVLLALSPFDIWPLGFLSVFFLLAAAQEQLGQNLRRILLSAVLFSLAVNCVTFGWIIATIHRYTGENPPLTVILGIAYALAFHAKIGAFFLINRYLLRQGNRDLASGLAIAAALAITDACMPELFPWSWGNTLAGEGHLRQIAAVGSVYLVGFTAALGGLILHWAVVPVSGETFPVRLKAAMPVAFVLGSFFIVGFFLRYFPSAKEGTRSVRVLVVQTNIGAAPEAKRSDAQFATDAINRLFNQSLEGLILHGDTNLVVWPEASMPFHAAEKNPANATIYSPTFDGVLEYLQRRAGVAVLFQDLHNRKGKLFSRFAVRPAGPDTAYFKRRLVPWGEYLPLENMLPAMRKFFPEAGHFTAAAEDNELRVRYSDTKPAVFSREKISNDLALLSSPEKIAALYPSVARNLSVAVKPLICYEALFPSDARSDADLIVNIASDAWFGDGLEGHQHASATVMRAVENGIPLVRAAMSGVSFAVDNRGEDFVPRTGQARSENLFAEIPLSRRKTVFARCGMAAFYCLMFAAVWPYLLLRFWRTRENK